MIVGPPLCDYFGTFETAKHGSRTAGCVKSLKASCRSWGEKPGTAAKPEDWEVGLSNIGQNDRKSEMVPFHTNEIKLGDYYILLCYIILCLF